MYILNTALDAMHCHVECSEDLTILADLPTSGQSGPRSVVEHHHSDLVLTHSTPCPDPMAIHVK